MGRRFGVLKEVNMKARDLLKFALTGLKRRKARTFVTVLGVIIGTVCIVLMFAIGLSNYKQFEQSMLSDQGLTEITVNNYSSGGVQSGITDSTIQSLGSLKHVKGVSPVVEAPVTIPSVVLGGTLQNFIDTDNPPNYADYAAMENYRPDIWG